jgi:hypothetical protein
MVQFQTALPSHTPPPDLGFGEPDDWLLRGTWYAALSIPLLAYLEYWIIRVRVMTGGSERSPDGANGSRECAPDDRLRAIRERSSTGPGFRFAPPGLQIDFRKADTFPRSRGTGCPRFAIKFPPSRYRGRRECRAPDAPRGLVCNNSVRCAHEHTGHTGITRHSPRNGLRLIRVLPGDRAFLPPSSARLSANLTPASGSQDHTTSPSAGKRCRLKRSPASTAARPANVTIATRPSVGTGWRKYRTDLDFGKTEIFLRSALCHNRKSADLIRSPLRRLCSIIRNRKFFARSKRSRFFLKVRFCGRPFGCADR